MPGLVIFVFFLSLYMERLWQYIFPSNRAPPESFHGLAWYSGAPLSRQPAWPQFHWAGYWKAHRHQQKILPSSNKSASADVISLSGKGTGPSCRIHLYLYQSHCTQILHTTHKVTVIPLCLLCKSFQERVQQSGMARSSGQVSINSCPKHAGLTPMRPGRVAVWPARPAS